MRLKDNRVPKSIIFIGFMRHLNYTNKQILHPDGTKSFAVNYIIPFYFFSNLQVL